MALPLLRGADFPDPTGGVSAPLIFRRTGGCNRHIVASLTSAAPCRLTDWRSFPAGTAVSLHGWATAAIWIMSTSAGDKRLAEGTTT